MSIKAYKGFNADMTCRGFQYEEGKEYSTDKAKICNVGFHACENPIDCLRYYNPCSSVYREVELDGETDRGVGDDTKISATKIRIGAQLSIPALCKAALEFVRSKCTNEHNAEKGKAATAGDSGAATAGDRGAATAGDSGAATSRGSVCVGENGIAAVRGNGIKAKGGLGAVLLIAVEESENYDIKEWKAIRIDGEKYKADTWYTLVNGKIVEAKED